MEDERKVVFNRELGRKVKYFRTRKGLGQVELGKMVGYTSTGMISQIERGLSGMEVGKLLKLAEILEVHPVVFLSGLELTDEQLQLFADFSILLTHPDQAASLDSIRTLIAPDIQKIKV